MAVTAADLRAEVQAGTSVGDALLTSTIEVAESLLREYVGEVYTTIPTKVFDRAWTAVAVDLFNQRRAPNGVLNQQFATETGSESFAVRISADPLRPARPLLKPWVAPLGIA